MEKKFGWRRLLALLLAVSMVFSSQAFTALADTVATISQPIPGVTYDLAEHPGWIKSWDPETQTGSHVSIESAESGKVEQFLPADKIYGSDEYLDFQVKNNCGVNVEVYWSVPNEIPFSPVKNGTKFTYQLPASLTFGVGQTFEVTDSNGKTIGTATVDETGLVTVTIEIDENIELRDFSAHFALWGTMDLKGKAENDTVELYFPEIGTRNVTVAEDLSSKRLGFTVGKGLASYANREYGWGNDGKLGTAVHYNEETGLIDEIWYKIVVTANETNEGFLERLEFDDEITNAWNGSEGDDLTKYFHIDTSNIRIVNFWRKSINDFLLDWYWAKQVKIDSVEKTGDNEDQDNKVHFEFDLSQLKNLPGLDLNGDEEGNGLEPYGLEPGDYITIVYPVRVDPKFWAEIPGGQTSESMVKLSGSYAADNSVTVTNEVGDENSATAYWSEQTEWLNKKGTVSMIDGKPYVHYEIYVYPTVSKTLAGWKLEDQMEGGNRYEYRDGVHIELYDQGNKFLGEETVIPSGREGHWEYTVPEKTIEGRPLERGDYLLVSYDVLYDKTVSKEDERLRNQIRMTITGIGPEPVGIESSFYSLDKKGLSKAEDVAEAAKSGESPLSWETVIGSITNAAAPGAESERGAVIEKGSTFWDVLTSVGPNHYFTEGDIGSIRLFSGKAENTVDTKAYEVQPVISITDADHYVSCKPGDVNCHGFLITFKDDVPAPVTVEYTSHSAKLNSGGSATYTNTSYFKPGSAGSVMSDADSLAYNETDYIWKLPQGIDYENGQAKWYILLNPKNNMKFGFDGPGRYKIQDVIPANHTFEAAYAIPYRNAAFSIEDTPEWWEAHKVKDVTLSDDERTAEFDVTEYLKCKQNGRMSSIPGGDFLPDDIVAIYIVTKIDRNVLLSNDLQTLENQSNLMYGGETLAQSVARQEIASKVLDKEHGAVDSEAKQLTYTVTVNEQGSRLTEPEGGEVTVVDTLQDGLRFPEDASEKVKVEVFRDRGWQAWGPEDSVTVTIEGKTLTLTYHDHGLPVRFTYVTELTGTGNFHVQNDVEVKVRGENVVSKSSDENVTIVGGTAGADGTNSIQIKKVSVDNPDEGLKGAEFDLFRFEKTGEEEWGWKSFTSFTTEDGGIWNGHKFVTNTLYKLVETKAPSGYGKAEDYYFVIQGTSEDDLDEQEKAEKADREFLTVNPAEGIVISDPVAGGLSLKKVKAGTTEGLPGAEFTVYMDADCATPAKTVNGGDAVMTTGPDGTAALSDLNAGIYYVRETKAPDGYQLSGEVYTVNVEAGKTAQVGGGDIENTPVAHAEFKLPVEKNLYTNGEVTNDPAATFAFQLAYQPGSEGSAGGYTDVSCERGEIRPDTPLSLTGVPADGSIRDFPVIYYNLPGEYTYILSETGTYDGIIKDQSEYLIAVHVGYSGADLKVEKVTCTTIKNPDGSVPEEAQTAENLDTAVTFNNSRETGDLTVTKIRKHNGVPAKVTEMFYVSLFDADGNRLYGPKPISLNDASEGEAKFEGLPLGTYYVWETDADGNKVAGTEGFEYQVEGDGTEVTIEHENLSQTAAITNYDADSSTGLKVTKELTGRNLRAGEFIFTLSEGAGQKTLNIAKASVTNTEDGTVRFADDVIEVTLTDMDGMKETTEGVFTKEFTYTLTEAPTSETGVENDPNSRRELKLEATYNKASGVLTLAWADGSDAQTFINTYTATASVPLSGRKTLKDLKLEADKYTFAVYNAADVTVAADGTVTAAGDPVLSAANAADGSITFGNLTYNLDDIKQEDGSYPEKTRFEYKVLEVQGTDTGITYDKNVKTVVVEVTYSMETGQLEAALVSGESDDLAFVNEYDTEAAIGFDAAKQMNGRALTADDVAAYRFTLTADDDAYAGTIQTKEASIDDISGTITGFEDAAIKITLDDLADVLASERADGIYTKDFHYTLTETGEQTGVTNDPDPKHLTLVATYNKNSGELGLAWADGSDNQTFINTYKAEGLGEADGRKVLNGRELQAGEFTFEVRNEAGQVVGTATNGADGSFRITGIGKELGANGEVLPFTEADAGQTFAYTLTEANGGLPGVNYSGDLYNLTAAVADRGDGTLDVTFTRMHNGEPLEEDDVITFINTFAGSVTLNKVSVDGTRLPGAVFQLYAQNADGSWGVYTGTNTTGTYTTDINGVVTVPNLPANNYYFVETQAPAGFIADPNTRYEFTISPANTSATVGVNVSLTVTNQPEPQEGQLVVTKELTNNGELWAAENATFYVALYSDAALTNRVSDIQAIEFRNASASSVIFTGLTNGQTYYVAEVDAAGNVLNNAGGVTSGEDIFTVNFMNGNEATIVEGEGTRTVFFRNEFMTIPEDYYREGELTVTKSLLGSDGAAKDSDETFYAGIFADEGFTTLSDQVSQNVIPLAMNGKSGVGNTVQVAIAPDAPQTLYVTETDENGKPVDGAVLFRYAINVENGTVTLDEANTAATVAITNIEDEEKYYREGELTITKRLLGADGSPKNSSETFYAGIFADANHTTLSDQVSQNIVPLALGGQSSVSNLVKVAIMPGDVQTLYVTEVDANGIPVANAASFRYDVTVEGAIVTMDENTVTASVTITNKESTAEEQSETTNTSVKTGDETPIIPFAIAFVVAAAALLIIGFRRRKRKDAE